MEWSLERRPLATKVRRKGMEKDFVVGSRVPSTVDVDIYSMYIAGRLGCREQQMVGFKSMYI
jgi:hypothetical protein